MTIRQGIEWGFLRLFAIPFVRSTAFKRNAEE